QELDRFLDTARAQGARHADDRHDERLDRPGSDGGGRFPCLGEGPRRPQGGAGGQEQDAPPDKLRDLGYSHPGLPMQRASHQEQTINRGAPEGKAGAPPLPSIWAIPGPLAAILLAGALFRAVYFYLYSRHSIYFDGLILDSSLYDAWA